MSARDKTRRSRRVAAVALFAAPLAMGAAAGCQQAATEVPTRSLERSGQTAFVCLGAPGSPDLTHPMADCKGVTAESETDFALGPHVYALVTQPTRGEIAVVDLTAGTGQVVDENPAVPGANFLPVGAQPADVVSTPEGTASFVAVAQIAHQGIFALPSSEVRPDGRPPPELSSWPACSLPVPPGHMILVQDPPNDAGDVRASCDGAYGEVPEAGVGGDLAAEGFGRPKLVVTLPDLGGIAVIDAQSVLDKGPGTYNPCTIERWVPLAADVPPSAPPTPSTGVACVQPDRGPFVSGTFDPLPSGLAFAGDHLYVGDLRAPVVHDVGMPTPCEPKELPPLLATSASDPQRVVHTSRIAVTETPTSKLQRFLYAIDVDDGSTMVFDVTPGAPRTPLMRPHPELNPFVPRDRLKFGAPPRDILLLQRDDPAANPITGVAPSGILCNPDPSATCDANAKSCDVGALYRTSSDYTTGAGPKKLRGTFAFIALESGQLAVVDVDDFDAPCRVPFQPALEYACAADDDTVKLASSGEVSCNVVLPHAPRDSSYFITFDPAGNHEAGLLTAPQLVDAKSGANLTPDGETLPLMVATIPKSLPPVNKMLTTDASGNPVLTAQGLANTFGVVVGGQRRALDDKSGELEIDGVLKNGLVMNHEDPRAQVQSQAWSITFEGALPGLSEKRAILEPSAQTITDPDSTYCTAGVQSETAVREQLASQGASPSQIDAIAPGLADFVVIASEIPEESDAYWQTTSKKPEPMDGGSASGDAGLQCNGETFEQCNTDFGTADAPSAARELRVVEAYQDHLDVAPRTSGGDLSHVHCCFPTALAIKIRVGHQWIAVGDSSGFLHHVIADPDTGRCRSSCDPALARLNGRIIETPKTKTPNPPVDESEPGAFINPMFRFAIVSGTQPSQRDFVFKFTTQNAFPALTVSLANTDNPSDVNPQSVSLVPATGELAIPDGSLQGLVLVSPDTLAVSRQIF